MRRRVVDDDTVVLHIFSIWSIYVRVIYEERRRNPVSPYVVVVVVVVFIVFVN
jgi:hypothetical protein